MLSNTAYKIYCDIRKELGEEVEEKKILPEHRQNSGEDEAQ